MEKCFAKTSTKGEKKLCNKGSNYWKRNTNFHGVHKYIHNKQKFIKIFIKHIIVDDIILKIYFLKYICIELYFFAFYIILPVRGEKVAQNNLYFKFQNNLTYRHPFMT